MKKKIKNRSIAGRHVPVRPANNTKTPSNSPLAEEKKKVGFSFLWSPHLLKPLKNLDSKCSYFTVTITPTLKYLIEGSHHIYISFIIPKQAEYLDSLAESFD